MSRLLFLLPAVPWPLDAGAKIRNHGLLSVLGAEHEVDVIAFGEGSLPVVIRRSATVPLPEHRSVSSRAMDVAQTGLPDMAHRLWSPAFAAQVRCFVSQCDYDAGQADGIERAR